MAVPARSRVDPARTSGPGFGSIGIIHGARQLRIRRATDAAGDRAHRARLRHGAQHVGRPSAGGDPHQHVARAESGRDQVPRAGLRIVLAGLRRPAQRRFAAGDDPAHQVRRRH